MFWYYLTVAAGIFLVVVGIMNVMGKELFLTSTRKKFTDESVDAWIRPSGISNIIFGIGTAMSGFNTNDSLPKWVIIVGYIFLVIGAALEWWFMKKYLVKR